MFTASNVLFVTIISLLAYKFILPRLNLKWILTKIYRWVIKPVHKFDKKLTEVAAEIKAEELILWLGLEEAADRKVNDYSSGMKQKAALAQALIHEPEILILDEPTANLDKVSAELAAEAVKEFLANGGRVLVAAHDEAWDFADRDYTFNGVEVAQVR